jgi:hypothetical protein
MLDEALLVTDAAKLERSRRDALCPSERADAISHDWMRIGVGIALAGGAYPIVLGAIFVAFSGLVTLWSILSRNQYGPMMDDVVGIAIIVPMYSMFGGMAGVLWSGFVSMLTLPVVYVFAWSLNLQTSIVRIGAFAGGLVGFICVLPLTLSVPWFGSDDDIWAVFVMALLGPMLTTVLGQLGGAWGGRRSREYQDLRADAAARVGLTPPQAPDLNPDFCSAKTGPRFQFGIRQLLWVSVWLSMLLALVRICEIPHEVFLPLVLAWALYQAATLWAGERLLPRLARWRKRNRLFRST